MGRLLLATLGLIALATPARADDGPPALCGARVIQATNDGEGVDPRIERVKPYLVHPPFTSWKKFVLLSSHDLRVEPHQSGSFDLPNGKKGVLTYVDHLLSGQGKHRLRLRLEVVDGPKRVLDTTFVLDEGGVVLQAGHEHQGHLRILAVFCDIDQRIK
jgi:hypothetical protein